MATQELKASAARRIYRQQIKDERYGLCDAEFVHFAHEMDLRVTTDRGHRREAMRALANMGWHVKEGSTHRRWVVR